MTTHPKIDVNRENALHSTGPRTEAGKSASAQNSLTLGLYTRGDYVKPEERDLYKQFCETMHAELSPLGLLEQSLTEEITGATWRLRRCSAVETELADYALGRKEGLARPYPHNDPSQVAASGLDPMMDEATEKTRRSIDRARAAAHSLLHRSINQLRKTQTERHIWHELTAPNPVPGDFGLASYHDILKALSTRDRGRILYSNLEKAHSASICDSGQALSPQTCTEDAPWSSVASFCNSTENASPSSVGSFCKPFDPTKKEGHAATAASRQAPKIVPVRTQVPRSAPCPCRSGQKYKRCCGKNAAPVLGNAA